MCKVGTWFKKQLEMCTWFNRKLEVPCQIRGRRHVPGLGRRWKCYIIWGVAGGVGDVYFDFREGDVVWCGVYLV